MKFYLLRFNRNWADEFDCDGFCVVNETEYNQLTAIFSSELGSTDMNFGFGTNEGWEGEFTYRDFWEDLTKREITATEAKFLNDVVLDAFNTFGIFPYFPWQFEDFEDADNELIQSYFDQDEAGAFNLFD